ncbi:MAG: hypothetical protein M3512_05350 [Bacteroidota bacterium]|nr:hypothetical protein [Bacteroidota bacterium]
MLSIVFLLLTAGGLTYIYKDKIINLFVEEVNKNIRTPVSVAKIDLSLFEKFPHLSVSLKNVVVQEGVENSMLPLAEARNIYCSFSIFDLLRGEYTIKQIFLEDAEVFLKVDKTGLNNYTILESSGSTEGSIAFKLEKVQLKNVLVHYTDEKRDQQYSAYADDIAASLVIENDIYDIGLKGGLVTKKIQIEGNRYFHDKSLYINTHLVYEDAKDKITIKPSKIKVKKSDFSISGYFSWNDVDKIDINVDGENTDIQTILSLLPEDIYNQFKIYSSKGEVYFNGNIKGEISRQASPAVMVSFGCKDASFSHPDFKKGISNVTLNGKYTNKKVEDLSSAILELNDVHGILEGRKFIGNLLVRDFNDYYVKGFVDAEIDIGSLIKFYPIERVKAATGQAKVKMSLEGRLNDLKSSATTNKLVTAGEIILNDLNFRMTTSNLPFEQFNGSFIFNNNDLGISDFSGNIGNSKFLLNGFFKNIVAFLVFKDQPIGIEADLSSQFLDFNELLSGDISEGEEKEKGEYHYSFEISPKLQLSFNCDIDKIDFRRFKGSGLKGYLKVNGQVAQTRNVTVQALGGKMKMDAVVDGRVKDKIKVKTASSFERIDIDSLFYVFNNFNQSFLIDKNLKGQIFADLATSMVFDDKLRLNPGSIVSDLEISIKNGELNNFAPMQNLSRFIDEASLSRLRFSDLKNSIHIEKELIYLPPMEIRTNVSTLLLGGTHSFDQVIDYRLQVPLKTVFKKAKDTGDNFDAIDVEGPQGARLFLTIKGTTDDYKIGYDTEAVKQKIKKDIKNEGKELKEIFKNKGKQQKETELDEEEYFDF